MKKKDLPFWITFTLILVVGMMSLNTLSNRKAYAQAANVGASCKAEKPLDGTISKKGEKPIVVDPAKKGQRVAACTYCNNQYTTYGSPYYMNYAWWYNCRTNPQCT